MVSIVIEVGGEEFPGILTDEHSPDTCRRILDALPVESTTRQWGDEIYFEIPVEADEENARDAVRVGDLAYWPAGSCFCIFYGKTPVSPSEEEIVPASPVNVVGHIENPEALKKHSAGEPVAVRSLP